MTADVWSAHCESLPGGQTIRLTLANQSELLSARRVIELWQYDPDFGRFFSARLAAAAFPAFFWEVRPLTVGNIDEPFECVLVDSPALAEVTADPSPFGTLLDPSDNGQGIAAFANLGGDA